MTIQTLLIEHGPWAVTDLCLPCIFSLAASSFLPVLLDEQPILRHLLHMQGSSDVYRLESLTPSALFLFYSSLPLAWATLKASRTPFPSPKALPYSSSRSRLHQYGLCLFLSSVPLPHHLWSVLNITPTFLLFAFFMISGFCNQSLLSKYVSSLWLYSSTFPAGTLVIWSITVYPPATALEMPSLSARSVVPLPQAVSGALTDCSITGSLAISSFGPSLYALLLVSLSSTPSSVTLLVLSMSSHITHHIYDLSLCFCSWTTACDERSWSRAGQLSANSHRLTSARPLLPGSALCT